MTPEPASVETDYAITRTLTGLDIEHAFIGGMAVSAWGVPRATFDLDLALSLPGKRQSDLLATLQ